MLKSFEAFARWQHPVGGELSARDFLPLIEQSQLLAPFAEWGIRQVLQQGRQWMRSALPLVPVSLNVSARQFLSVDLVGICGAMSQELGIGLEWLRFDLDETALLADLTRAAIKITALAQLGILVNVDHFGQGFVPLNRICELKLNKIKIVARHFDAGSQMKSNDALISIIKQVGRILHLPIVATQIETEAMAFRATAVSIEYLQGHLICRPLNSLSAEAWLRGRIAKDEPDTPATL